MPNYVKGCGYGYAKLMIIGQAPGEHEDEIGKPFIGPSGRELDQLCIDAGFPRWREEAWVTNVSKFRPPNNDFKRLHEVADYDEQVRGLWEEIHAIKPHVILALGDDALFAVSGKRGISNYRGSILQSLDGIPKVVPTFHPSNLVRGNRRTDEDGESLGEDAGKGIFKYAYREVMISDIRRAIEESKYEDLRLPDRCLRIARNSGDVYEFINRNKGKIPTIDIEAFRCIPTCVSLAFDKYEALSTPLFRKVGRVEICKWTDSDMAHCWNILDDLYRNSLVIGHNIKYDIDKLMMLGFKFRGVYCDTLLLAHTINPEMPRKTLAFLASTMTREPYYKDEGKEFDPRKDKIDRLLKYNANDSAVDYEVFEELDGELDILSEQYSIHLRPFFYDYVMQLLPLYLRMENRGLRIDESERERIRYKYEKWHDTIQNRFLDNLGHEVNVMENRYEMPRVLYEELKCPRRKGCSEDTIAALLQNNIKDERRKRILSDILEDRRVRKTLGTYINAETDFDGRIRTSYRITGTETGRSSTGILKPPLRPHKQGMAFQTITKHGDIGADIREYLIPDEGKVFVQVDLSQAEARVVAVLSEDYELLQAFNNIDIHRRTAALIFDYTRDLDLSLSCKIAGIDINERILKDSPERFMGKKTRHAGNYNMGKHRFMVEVTNDAKKFGIDIKISEWKAGQTLDKFHRASPKIRGVFHRDIRAAIDDSRVLINPFGRFRMFFERSGEDLYKEAFAFIPQSCVRDHLAQAWLRISQEIELDVVIEAHDSLTFQCREDEINDICKVVKREFEKPIDFSQCSLKRDIQLVIPADIEIGYENLKEFTKYKLREVA